MTASKNETKISRAPVVVVMGHIDHGKSTLLDYIRKTNVTGGEIGGITQNISAYEVEHEDESGQKKNITFLDTPGHEAFSKMRERGAKVADIGILVVSAEDGVKPQTVEAWKTIQELNLSAVVAINKIDKPGANIEKTKKELSENEIYLESYGGKIPSVEISAKTGEGIDGLLSIILLMAEMENFEGNPEEEASGFVIESNIDSRRGIEATLIIKNGTLKKGMTVAAEDSLCSARTVENFLGKAVNELSFSSPARIFGFDKMPRVGAMFKAFKNKKEAEKYAQSSKENRQQKVSPLPENSGETGKKIIPLVLKADVAGSLEAIEKEISKIKKENAEFRIISSGVGSVSESDVKSVSGNENVIIVGFKVKTDRSALELAQKRGLTISFFDIIYKMTEWLDEELEKRRPRIETTEITGRAKILRAFSRTKERQIVGGKVIEGKILLNGTIKIIRREFEIGRGKIVNLEQGKVKTGAVDEGMEFGMMIESKTEIAQGDTVELFSITEK